MNTPETIKPRTNNFWMLIQSNWENLENSQKLLLQKIWKVITYKWQLQIILNLPFLIWWLLDTSLPNVHEFDKSLISYLNLPEWALSFIGFGQ